jgi:hypothetical protein
MPPSIPVKSLRNHCQNRKYSEKKKMREYSNKPNKIRRCRPGCLVIPNRTLLRKSRKSCLSLMYSRESSLRCGPQSEQRRLPLGGMEHTGPAARAATLIPVIFFQICTYFRIALRKITYVHEIILTLCASF